MRQIHAEMIPLTVVLGHQDEIRYVALVYPGLYLLAAHTVVEAHRGVSDILSSG